MAEVVISIMRDLADRGRIVMTVVHCPSSEVRTTHTHIHTHHTRPVSLSGLLLTPAAACFLLVCWRWCQLMIYFSHMLLLTHNGRLAFHGPRAAAVPHFESLG